MVRRRKLVLLVGLLVVLAAIGAPYSRWPGRGLLTYLGKDFAPAVFKWGQPSRYVLAQPRDDLPGVANFAQVSPVLFRGAQPTPEGFQQLKQMGVRTIVDLREFHSDAELMEGLGMRLVRLRFNPAKPTDDLVAAFLQVVQDPANQPVFVHCKAGADRTGTMVAIYRVVVQGWPVGEAVKELPRFRFHAVWTDLMDYLACLDRARLQHLAATRPPPEVEVVP